MDGFKANIIDVGVGKVIPGGRQSDVDLARQVHQLLIALAKVCNHVIDLCSRGNNIQIQKVKVPLDFKLLFADENTIFLTNS